MRRRSSSWLAWALLAPLAGCSQLVYQTACRWGDDSGAATPVSHTSATLDLDKLPDLDRHMSTAAGKPYRTLTAKDCQCLAAKASRLATALEQEAKLVGGKHAGRRGASLQQAVLETAALEARNKDAGTALDLFYRLAEAEAKRDLLDASLAQVRDAVARGDKLKQQGLRVPAEFADFKKQELELQADSIRLDAGIQTLNRLLAKALDMKGFPEHERFAPAGDFQMFSLADDVDANVGLGLQTRPELQMLRRARDETSPTNLAAARKLLAAGNGLLGMNGSSSLAKLRSVLCANETAVRREQLDQYSSQREDEIAGDIRQAMQDLRTETQLVGVARQRAANAQARLKEQEDKQAKGTISVVDVANARLIALKARGDLIHEVMAWHIARVKLKEAQGLLAAECGYDIQSQMSGEVVVNIPLAVAAPAGADPVGEKWPR